MPSDLAVLFEGSFVLLNGINRDTCLLWLASLHGQAQQEVKPCLIPLLLDCLLQFAIGRVSARTHASSTPTNAGFTSNDGDKICTCHPAISTSIIMMHYTLKYISIWCNLTIWNVHINPCCFASGLGLCSQRVRASSINAVFLFFFPRTWTYSTQKGRQCGLLMLLVLNAFQMKQVLCKVSSTSF